MSNWSISFSFRLGLGFHALNNEGADGSNLMQPRRIDVRSLVYDGISGEIVRRHILENFVNQCRLESVPVLPLSAALHPDRGPIAVRAAAKLDGSDGPLRNDILYPSARKAIEHCAVVDAGGYLAAWQDQSDAAYVAEGTYISSECAPLARNNNKVDVLTIKRESCFDVGWLISEHPQDASVTQHSAFRDTGNLNSRFAMTMRSNVYGGVVRIALHRIGTDDHWHLQQKGTTRLAIKPADQRTRQLCLIRAVAEFIASPTGARVAAWGPHVFLSEGAIVLSKARTAPFVSPVTVDLNDTDSPVHANPQYRALMLKNVQPGTMWAWEFAGAHELMTVIEDAAAHISGEGDGEAQV